MRVSLDWLSDYVDHGLAPDALAELLTMSGLEVEEVLSNGPQLEGVVVGHVLDTRAHPDADRLTLCTVDLGPDLTPDAPLQIVCGAPNVAPGQKVAVATVDSTLMLPSREDPAVRQAVTIRRARIRGEESNGMICAEDELGLGDDHAGILVLSPDAEVGQSFAAFRVGQGLDDVVLDVNITPNRPDATSHVGVARDVAALTGRPLRVPTVSVPRRGGEAAEAIEVQIDDADGCGRYSAVLVRGVTVGPSPEWLRKRLEAVGGRSINNVVDVTNYVMRELGQPLHAFDLAKVAAARIVVRSSTAGDVLQTLDGVERKIPEDAVLICDSDRPIAIGGVMGGANSEVDNGTTDVLIESAWFDPVRVRRAARALGLSTDASYRFERGVDPTGQARAAARAASLIVDVAGGTVVPGMAEAHPHPHRPVSVLLRPGRMRRLLGAAVPLDEAGGLLRSIGFEVEEAPAGALDAFAEEIMRSESLVAAEHAADSSGFRVTVPPFRPDVTREVDVIEEVARLWGFDRIEDPAYASVPLQPPAEDLSERRLATVTRGLVGVGFREVYTNSLVSDSTAVRFADAAVTGYDVDPVRTLNPISQEMAALRTSLLPGLLEVVAYNQARGADVLRLFELGRVYARGARLGPNEDVSEPIAGYHEHTALSVVMAGAATERGWDTSPRAVDFFDLKGALVHALSGLDLPAIEEIAVQEIAGNALLAERLILECSGRRLGVVGRVAPALATRMDLRGEVFVAEVDADLVAALDQRDGPPRYVPVSPFPVVERDLAVVLDEAVPVGPLAATIREAGQPLVQDVRVFDLFRGERVGTGQKSVAFSIRMGAGRTLTDEEVDGRMRRIVKSLEAEHGARLRE